VVAFFDEIGISIEDNRGIRNNNKNMLSVTTVEVVIRLSTFIFQEVGQGKERGL
jgi:hypothetical protein